MSLKKGGTGTAVADLQRRLTKAGYPVAIDGWFGDATEQALLAFQRDHMIAAIGQAGPRTMAALLGSERGNQLTINHMQEGADLLGLPLATMATVAQVESIGEGFTQDQRPVVLFERHVFYKQLTKHQGKATANQLAASYPNLVNPKRGGYAGGAVEWERLQLAISLHRDAAIESASWGMFQIMGYHWQALGFASASDWMGAMQRSEVDHLTALCRFIQQDLAMHKALQGRKWADFARRYNGPAFKDNDYDTKLAKAYDHFAKVYPVKEVAHVA
ncbi:N-acetylmuramidase domain-containing protein [Aeromonas salmonicida]|uniref:N-acetylmuramidase domain-containing protein n=1 Tax=Aeromonas salmonicida TaxID=645 RepID=UPI001BAD7A49|nr:N-acetylmuramidase family protein [Aeromonas salmonicida]MBS2782730.1 N-acetylmuramidase family protein [Aeromonas salmonicida]